MRFLAAAIVAVAFAAQAAAKDGVVAHLENPAVLRAAPGKRIVLVWTLRAGTHPFGASGIYVRLRGRATSTGTASEVAPGRFRARLTVPRDGVRSIVIALRGWRSDVHGTVRADLRFPIDNDPTR